MSGTTGNYSFIANPLNPKQDQPANPLTMGVQYAYLQNALNENQKFQAQQAAGQEWQKAIDPATGQLNVNKLMTGVAQNPAAALAAGDTVRQAQEQVIQQLNAQGLSLNQAMTKTAYLANEYAPLLAQPNITPQDVYTAGAQAVANNIVTKDEFVRSMATMPTDPAGLRQWVQHQLLTNQNHHDLLQALFPTPTLVTTGPNVTFVRNSQVGAPSTVPVTGPGTSGGTIPLAPSPQWHDTGPGIVPTTGNQVSGPPIPKGNTPEADTQPIDIINPSTGERKTIQRWQLSQYTGWRPMAGSGAAPPTTTGGAPSAPGGQQPGGGTTAPAPASPAAPGKTAAATPPSAEPRGLPSGLPAGAEETYRASSQNFANAQTYASTYQDRVQPLERSLEALQTAKTGLGSQALHDLFSRLQTVAPDFVNRFVNPQNSDEIAAYDEVKKYLTQTATTRPGAGRSDLGLQTAEQSSPSVNISPQAAKMLITAQLGFERMKQAQYLEFVATHPNAATRGQAFNDYMANQTYKLDPRAFIADQQTPAQRAAVLNSMKKGSAAYNNYMRSYQMAKQYNLGGLGS